MSRPTSLPIKPVNGSHLQFLEVTRYLEVFFRHKRGLVSLLALSIGAGALLALTQPRTFQASSRLWFEKSTLGDASGLNSFITPADQAAGVFKELLGTREFCLAVGHRGNLRAYLAEPGHLPGPDPVSSLYQRTKGMLGEGDRTDRSTRIDDAIQELLQKKVVIRTSGAEVVDIAFEYSDPRVAAGTLQALLDQFSEQVLNLRRTQAQNQVKFYQAQSIQLEAAVAAADSAVSAYIAVHPEQRSATPPQDANLASLQQADKLAHDRYASLVQQSDRAQLQLASETGPDAAGFRVLDKPEIPHLSKGLSKILLLYLAGGAAAGLVLVILAMVFVMLSDNTMHLPTDLEQLGLGQVVGSVPRQHRLRGKRA